MAVARACDGSARGDDGGVLGALHLYLASKSPRRQQLLTQAGLRFEVVEPGDEYADGGSEHRAEAGDPRRLCAQRAERKAVGAIRPVAAPPAVPVLAVDTVVDLDGVEIGKAADRDAAAALLARLAGRDHHVHTAHCLVGSDGVVRARMSSARVRCARPDAAALQVYLDSGQWRGKAGGYGIQDPAQQFLQLVEGAFDTVVGLHLPAVHALLAEVRT